MGEVDGVCPASDGEEGFELAVAFLGEVELFEVTVEVIACVVPGVGREVDVGVGPGVGEVDFTGFGADVGEGI